MNWILENADDLLAIIGGVVLVCSIIVKLTPTKRDDEILGKVVKVLERFSVLKVTK